MHLSISWILSLFLNFLWNFKIKNGNFLIQKKYFVFFIRSAKLLMLESKV